MYEWHVTIRDFVCGRDYVKSPGDTAPDYVIVLPPGTTIWKNAVDAGEGAACKVVVGPLGVDKASSGHAGYRVNIQSVHEYQLQKSAGRFVSRSSKQASMSRGRRGGRRRRRDKSLAMAEFQPPAVINSMDKKSVHDANGAQTPILLSSLRSVLFVISSALIGFAAFRNTLTWHLQRFWGASGDFWQALWDKFLDTVGEDPTNFWVYGTIILTTAVYWIFGGIYTILDVTNKPAALRRYKIQPGTNEPVDTKRLMKVVGWVLFNQFVVGIPVLYLSYLLMRWRGFPAFRELPTFHWVLAEMAIHILLEEVGFYYSHRLLHSRHLYRYIHKKHHEWTAPIAVTAIYCHPIEHVFSNLLPPFLGVFIMGSHVATAWLWFSLAILSTLNAHSGYHLPFFPSPEAHDFHHLKFNQCFGVLGVLDRIHGTDTLFRNTQAYARHIMMLSLVPARELFPEPAKCKAK